MSVRRPARLIIGAAISATLLLGFVGLSAPVQAATLNVTDEASLRAAITNAVNGDIIEFVGSPGSITLTQDLPVLDDSVRINGHGWQVDGVNQTYRGFIVDGATVTFDDVNVEQALEYGIRVDNDANVTYEHGRLRGISRPNPEQYTNETGGILVTGDATVNVNDAVLWANYNGLTAQRGNAKITVSDNTEIRNSSSAGINVRSYTDGSLTVTDTYAHDNSAAIAFWGSGTSSATITRTNMQGNFDVGMFINLNDNATVAVNDSDLSYTTNGIYGGAGVHMPLGSKGKSVTFTDSRLDYNDQGVSFDYAGNNTSFIRTSISHNARHGIFGNTGGPVSIEDSSISDNGRGSQHLNSAGMRLVLTSSTLDIVRSTFADNGQEDLNLVAGGASVTTVENSTFTGLGPAFGKTDPDQSLNITGSGTFNLRHSTVAGVGDGTAAHNVLIGQDVKANITHSIITGKNATNAFELAGNATANVDWSLLDTVVDTSTGNVVTGAGVQTGVTNFGLAPLADNGGLTKTHLLQTGSPAIDAGNPLVAGAPEHDQRGLARILGDAIDIGSVEVNAPATSPPEISNPSAVTVAVGEDAKFEVTASGVPTPVVTWEVSTDDGESWGPITGDGSSLTVTATAGDDGNLYRATAKSSAGEKTSKSAKLTVTPATSPPEISNPSAVTVAPGAEAAFSVTASGVPTPVVTWELSTDGDVWEPITGDGSSLTVTATADDDGNLYRATAKSSAGEKTSLPAKLTVTAATSPPEISNPSAVTVAVGEDAKFEVTASGVPAPAVTWEVSTDGGVWEPIAGDGSSLTVTATADDDGNLYRATAKSSAGEKTSLPAKLTVTPATSPPEISNPSAATVAPGAEAVFSVTASGVPTPVVTWEVSTDDGGAWAPISGDGSSLTVTASADDDGNLYRATAKSSAGEKTSLPAKLTVTPAATKPEITNPGNVTVTEGKTATFTVTASGTPDPAVTWEVSSDDGDSWSSITSNRPIATLAVDSSLRIVTTEDDDGNLYRAVATNSEGTTRSAPALLVVKPAGSTPTPGGGDDTPSGSDAALPDTGSEVPMLLPVAGVISLLLGSALLVGSSITRRRPRVRLH